MKAGQVPGWSPMRIQPQLGQQPLYLDQITGLWHNPEQSRSAFDGGGDYGELGERSSHLKPSEVSHVLGSPGRGLMAGFEGELETEKMMKGANQELERGQEDTRLE
jgi:hypothetical protein